MNEEFTKMVSDLMKKGSVMKQEWTNDEKEKFKCLCELNKIASKLWSKTDKYFFPLGIEEDYEIYHMVSAFVGEVGELFDAVKKSVVYRKPLDVTNVLEEFGDLCFYAQGIQIVIMKKPNRYSVLVGLTNELFATLAACIDLFGLNLEDIKKDNIEKLLKGKKARYKSGEYTDDQAKERADKSNPYINLEFNLSQSLEEGVETLKVRYYPDVPSVNCLNDDIILQYVSRNGSIYDQELLIQMCKSKVEKEGSNNT